MRRWWQLLVAVLVILGLLCEPTIPVAAKQGDSTRIPARGVIVTDAQSGQTLFSQTPDRAVPIASLTKMMTAYLTRQAIAQGKLTWNEAVPVSSQLIRLSHNSVLSTMPMTTKKTYTVRQLFEAAMIASSNSAATALGVAVAGSNAAFVAQMNAQAHRWHLNAHFISSSGLGNVDLHKYGLQLPGTTAKADNLVSARAINEIGRHFVNDYPDVINTTKRIQATVNGTKIFTANDCLPGMKNADKQSGIDGLKTGFTDEAKLCLTATFKMSGRRMVATILGSDVTFSAMNKLIKRLKKTMVLESQPLSARSVAVMTGLKQSLAVQPSQSMVGFWAPQGDIVKTTSHFEVTLPPSLLGGGDLAAQQPVGQLQVTDNATGTTEKVVYQAARPQRLVGWTTPFRQQITMDTPSLGCTSPHY